jgi:hypothetical protein
MTGKFQHRDLVYNRITAEDGAIRKVYGATGAVMYEVAVPKPRGGWTAGFYISDWSEEVLQLSNNQNLKSSMEQMSDANLLT